MICHTLPDELFGVGRFYADFSAVSDSQVISLLAAAARDLLPTPGQMAPPTHHVVHAPAAANRELLLEIGGVTLAGDLTLPRRLQGVVIFAHGSGSSRLSPRNREVAATLNDAGLATLLLDLLSDAEARRRELVFDIPLLARRLEQVTRWVIAEPDTKGLPVGYFGASTGAAAALRAAAAARDVVKAVVSRGGRPDLAADRLPYVTAPTLLLVGGLDHQVLALNRRAAAMFRCEHQLTVIDGAGHLFGEPGRLDQVARLAADWFQEHLTAARPQVALVG